MFPEIAWASQLTYTATLKPLPAKRWMWSMTLFRRGYACEILEQGSQTQIAPWATW